MGETTIDLFADRTNHQKLRYVSWKPDPYAYKTDALQMEWKGEIPYAFPPFCLIGRVLKKVKNDKVTMILITPTWPNQPWYPTLLEMSMEKPILLPPMPNLCRSSD